MHRQRIGVLVDPLRRLLRRGAKAHATNLLSKLHAADVARLLQVLNDEESQQAFSLVLRDDPSRAGEALAELEPSDALRYLGGRSDREVADILSELGADDAAELVEAFPDGMKEGVLEQLERAGQPQVESLLQYEEVTAGRIMAPEVFALRQELTVSEAIAAIRSSSAEDLEMVFYLYVVDAEGQLAGVCSLRDLLLARESQPLSEVMNPQLVAVSVDTDQEEVAQLVARYNYLALPVVDHDAKLVGLITVDDVIDIIREEETEDILLMAGVGEDEEEVLTAPLWRNAWLRLPWLFAAWIGGILASQVMAHYSDALGQMVALSFFIPIIVGMGGNVGTQASTIVVRGLATGRLIDGQSWYTVLRELRVALALGVFFGVLLGLTVLALNPGQPSLGVAVGVALISSMALAAAVGASTPLILRRFGIDPAIATGPFVTTSVDVLGIMAYFSIASALVL
jgi:magnesium transporter